MAVARPGDNAGPMIGEQRLLFGDPASFSASLVEDLHRCIIHNFSSVYNRDISDVTGAQGYGKRCARFGAVYLYEWHAKGGENGAVSTRLQTPESSRTAGDAGG